MGQTDKIFAPLVGRPLISHSVDVMEQCPAVDRTVLVLSGRSADEGLSLVRRSGWSRVTVTVGGSRRQDSVHAGLRQLGGMDWIVVHDGARPLITPSMIETGLSAAQSTGAAIAAVPVKDTVKMVDRDMTVTATPDRSALWLVQTPQVFSAELLERAHREVEEDVTDDASMVELTGGAVRIFEGSYANIKVTTPEDMAVAAHLLAARAATPA